ncbi:MAG: hypothetical protein QXE38_04575 [Candidatus Methanomethylicia archaeon]
MKVWCIDYLDYELVRGEHHINCRVRRQYGKINFRIIIDMLGGVSLCR